MALASFNRVIVKHAHITSVRGTTLKNWNWHGMVLSVGGNGFWLIYAMGVTRELFQLFVKQSKMKGGRMKTNCGGCL
jgi:hypothetical protein